MDNQLNKEALLQLHRQSRLSADYKISEQNTTQIIQALGGINAVLEVCLNSKAMKLTESNKLHSLHQIMTDSNKIVKNDNNGSKEDCSPFEYTFDESNTFLHSLLGPSKGHKIQTFVEHKMVIASLVLISIIWLLLYILFGETHTVTLVYMIVLESIIALPWLISKHTLFNKKAFKLCLKTFDYWIKIGYALLFVICEFFYLNQSGTISVMAQCFRAVLVVSFISLISSFDAFVMGKKKKLFLCGVGVLGFTVYALKYQFLASDESDYKIEFKYDKGTHVISMISLLRNSTRILSIFLLKQTRNTLITLRRPGKAVSLTVTPTIKWINSKTSTAESRAEQSENKSMGMELSEIDIKCVSHRKHNGSDSVSFSSDEDNMSVSSTDSSGTKQIEQVTGDDNHEIITPSMEMETCAREKTNEINRIRSVSSITL